MRAHTGLPVGSSSGPHSQAWPTSPTGRRHGLGQSPRKGTGSPQPCHPTPWQHMAARRPAYARGLDSRPRQCVSTPSESLEAAGRGGPTEPGPWGPQHPASPRCADLRGLVPQAPRLFGEAPAAFRPSSAAAAVKAPLSPTTEAQEPAGEDPPERSRSERAPGQQDRCSPLKPSLPTCRHRPSTALCVTPACTLDAPGQQDAWRTWGALARQGP